MKNLDEKILVTHPGKLGDLVYSLGAIRALSKHFDRPLSILISHYCRPIVNLLLTQSYIDKVIVDFDYKIIHEHRGYQPYKLKHQENFQEIFELGYREKDDYDLQNQHLTGYGFYALESFYNIKLPILGSQNLTLPFSIENADYFIFQGFGETLDVVLGPERVNKIMLHWAAVLKSTNKKIIVLTGPRESNRYRLLGFETFVSYDLLDTAIMLTRAKGIIASQSIIAAISNELQISRLILGLFPNAVPTGKNGLSIPLLDDSVSNAEFLQKWMIG